MRHPDDTSLSTHLRFTNLATDGVSPLLLVFNLDTKRVSKESTTTLLPPGPPPVVVLPVHEMSRTGSKGSLGIPSREIP